MAKTKGTEDQDDNQDGEDGKTPAYVTSEQLNAAIASKLGEFSKKLPKLLEPTLASFSSQIMEGLAGKKPEGEGKDSQGNAELEKLRRENQATKDALAKMQADQERQVKQAKAEKARGLLEASLTGVKVHPKLLPAATRLLEDCVGESEDGRIVFRRTNSYGVSEEVSVDEAVKAWAKTEDGKAFIAAPRAGGSGAAPAGRPAAKPPAPGPDGKVSDAEKLRAAKQELAEAMLGIAPAASE